MRRCPGCRYPGLLSLRAPAPVRCLADYEAGQSIKQPLERFDTIQHVTSRIIAENYEEYPYPHWIHLDIPNPSPRRNRLAEFFATPELDLLDRSFKVLVAG